MNWGMRAMQERAYEKRGEQYLLIKAPARFGQEPCTDVYRAGQTGQSGDKAGDHHRAGKIHRRQF